MRKGEWCLWYRKSEREREGGGRWWGGKEGVREIEREREGGGGAGLKSG